MYRVISAALVTIALACNGHHDAPPPPPAQRDLTLISPGMPPLATLRYRVAKGTTTSLAMDVTTHLVAGDQSDESPPVHVVIDLVVDDVLPDGKMKLTSTIRSLAATAASRNGSATNANGSGAEDPTQAHVDAVGSGVSGLAFTATMAPDGSVTDVKATDQPLPELAKAELDRIVASFTQLAMTLPDTPVGIGAKWRITRNLTLVSTLAVQATTTIDLLGVTRSSITYAVASQLTGSAQTVVEDGTSVQIDGIGGSVQGSGTLDLGTLATESSQVAEQRMTMTTGSDRTPMEMTQTLRTSTAH
ncbi:MAG TPA: hypothetical protein VGG28_31860 [Kofleriaceae bacterium]